MRNYQELIEFIDRAKRSRKYPEATAANLQTAVRLYEGELSEEEKVSLDKFIQNFDQITRSVFSKNQSRFTASSLATYRSRVQKVLDDYEKYGDPIKMNSWNPKVIIRAKKTPRKIERNSEADEVNRDSDDVTSMSKVKMHRIEFALRENAKALIVLPLDITAGEIKRVKGVIDAMCAPSE